MKASRVFCIMLMAGAALGAQGCSWTSSSAKAVRLSEVRPPLGSITVVDKQVSRAKYMAALEQGGDKNQARLVPVFGQSSDWENFPEYRLLDMQRGSVYEVLGLQSLDIIVAANDFVIPSSQKFWQFLGLISRYQGATIEIRRNDRPMLMKYEFIEEK